MYKAKITNLTRGLLLLLVGMYVGTTQAQFRKYSNEFLNIGAGAKGLAMGGAQVATTTDATAGYWNPAGLSHLKSSSFSLNR